MRYFRNSARVGGLASTTLGLRRGNSSRMSRTWLPALLLVGCGIISPFASAQQLERRPDHPPAASPAAPSPKSAAPAASLAPAPDRNELVSGTPIWIKLDQSSPLRTGAPISGRLTTDVYSVDHLVLPAGSRVTGHIAATPPVDRATHRSALLNGDFTPLKQPEMSFDSILLPDGRTVPITADATQRDQTMIAMQAATSKRPSRFAAFRDSIRSRIHDATQVATAPHKRERLQRFFYSELPWHPQKAWSGTQYVADLTSPSFVPPRSQPAAPPDSALAASGAAASQPETPAPFAGQPFPSAAAPFTAGHEPVPEASPAESPASADPPIDPDTPSPVADLSSAELKKLLPQMHLEARMTADISSATAKQGDPVVAILTRPVFAPAAARNLRPQLVFPEGTRLTGAVIRTKMARRWGRNGALRFTFHSIDVPAGSLEVQGQVAAIDGDKGQNLSVDSEGGTKANPDKNRFLGPLTLALMANGAADSDHVARHSAVAGNGFGVAARIAVTAIANQGLTVGLAAFDFSKSIYSHWIARGHDVVFQKDTRLVIDVVQH